MASHGRGNHRGRRVPVTTPSFIVVVLAEALEDGKLEIPATVVRRFGNLMAETILVNVPNGGNWLIGLTKSNGKIWLQKGWPAFARRYSLQHGSVLLFSFQEEHLGDESSDYSYLRVQIFDRNTVEINYLPNASSTMNMNHASSSPADAFSDDDDDDDALSENDDDDDALSENDDDDDDDDALFDDDDAFCDDDSDKDSDDGN